MSPRFKPILLPNRLREAAAPALARIRLIDIVPGDRVDDLRVNAHVVVDGRELDELSQERDLTDGT